AGEAAQLKPADGAFMLGAMQYDRNRAAGLLEMQANGQLAQDAFQRAALDKVNRKVIEEMERADKAKAAEPAKEALAKMVQDQRRAQLPQAQPCFVREYAHQRFSGPDPDERVDFTETLFWHPVVVLPEGKAEVTFELCDSVTSFQVVA